MMRIAFFILPFVIFSCKEKKGYVSKYDKSSGEVTYSVPGDDKEMNKAIIDAKRTYNDFLIAFRNPDSFMEDFSVKMRFNYGDNNAEHMWLYDLYSKKEKLFGILGSDPIEIKTIKAGDTLEIIPHLISDWRYLKNNKLVGGYTIRVLYNKMSTNEKEEFKKVLGFELE